MISIDIIAETCLLPEDVTAQLGENEIPQVLVLWGGISEVEVKTLLLSLARYNHISPEWPLNATVFR
jgi:hypothetical protein